MHNAADGARRFGEHGEGFGNIVSDLISLVEQVQASITLIEGAITREMTSGDEDNSNVIVLDDVTPQYMKASTAMHSCRASLGTALQVLLDARGGAHEPARRSLRG
jgi:hypothetical protein